MGKVIDFQKFGEKKFDSYYSRGYRLVSIATVRNDSPWEPVGVALLKRRERLFLSTVYQRNKQLFFTEPVFCALKRKEFKRG